MVSTCRGPFVVVWPTKMRSPHVAAALLLVAATAAVDGAPNYQGCISANATALPFCDSSLSHEARVEDLLGRLTLAEKVQLVSPSCVDCARARPRHAPASRHARSAWALHRYLGWCALGQSHAKGVVARNTCCSRHQRSVNNSPSPSPPGP